MSKKIQRKKRLLIFNIVSAIIGVVSIALLIIGGVKMSGLDIKLSEEQIKCDDKDYSSYVKVNRVETPGNENINNQIDIVKRAMESASNDNDMIAYGQLWEKYSDLLNLQSTTKTINETPDYSEATKARNKCYKLAQDQRDVEFTKSIWLLAIGGGIFVILLAVCIPVNLRGYSHKK